MFKYISKLSWRGFRVSGLAFFVTLLRLGAASTWVYFWVLFLSFHSVAVISYPDQKQLLEGKLSVIELWDGGSHAMRLPSPGRYSAAGEYGPSGWIQRKEMSFSAPWGASFVTDGFVRLGLHPSDGFSSLESSRVVLRMSSLKNLPVSQVRAEKLAQPPSLPGQWCGFVSDWQVSKFKNRTTGAGRGVWLPIGYAFMSPMRYN